MIVKALCHNYRNSTFTDTCLAFSVKRLLHLQPVLPCLERIYWVYSNVSSQHVEQHSHIPALTSRSAHHPHLIIDGLHHHLMKTKAKAGIACLTLWLFCLPYPARCAFEPSPTSARASGMGGADIALFMGPESILANPAGMIKATDPALTLFYRNPYNLKELHHGVVSAVLPTRIGCIGFGFQSFGSRLYRESTLAFAWGLRIGEKISFGVLLRACHLAIHGYGATAAILLDPGCIVQLNAQTHWGFAVSNLSQARLGRSRDILPQVLRTGFAFMPSKSICLAVELDKDTRYPLRIKGGCEFQVHPLLSLRCGFMSDPSHTTAGMAVKKGIFILDYAFIHHPILGSTHQASFTLALKGKTASHLTESKTP